MEPNPTLPANDIDLSKFVPAVGEDIPRPKRLIIDDEDDPEDDGPPVELQRGPWEGVMDPEAPNPGDAAAEMPMYIPPPPSLPLTNEQVDEATRPRPTPAQIEQQRRQQKRKTEAEKKAEEGVFIGAVKGLLGLEKKKVDAQKAREVAEDEQEKEANEKYELCKRLIMHFPTMVPHTNIRPGMRVSTYDKFIADAKFNLNSGRIFENGKATAKWASKLTEIGGSLVGLELRGPRLNFTDTMSDNIDNGMFDDEIKEITVFYPQFFVRPLWLRILEKIFFVAATVHEANSGGAARLMAGPQGSQHVSAAEMGQFAG